MNKIKAEIIKYSNSKNTIRSYSNNLMHKEKLNKAVFGRPFFRSGNISVRFKDGFLITPSGKKYSTLKNKDIVFVSLNGGFDKKKGIPSSEWKFHQDIYKNKKEAKAIVHAHSTNATAVSTHNKGKSSIEEFLFITWLQWLVAMTLNVQNMQPLEQESYLKIF